MSDPRKFAYLGYQRDTNEFKEYQILCHTESEVKAIIEGNNVAFMLGGFIDDKKSFESFVDAPMLLYGANHKFFEKRKNPNWPL